MPATKTRSKPALHVASPHQDWLAQLDKLLANIQAWGRELDWATRRIEKRMRDADIGSYLAPALLLQHETLRLLVEPISSAAPGVDGLVEVYLMPAYDDVARLFLCDGRWSLSYVWSQTPRVQFGIEPKPIRLTKAVFHRVVDEMKNNATQD